MLKSMILPLAVLAMLASILVPMPAPAMDFLLVGNLLLSLVLLTSTFYLSDPLKLSTLPTVLLLATMLRLALNISTTRLILGSGDAGRVVEAFGSVVIQGSLGVGIVVFAVITLVQFLVIAKGSERVAEVSARFTLDAMPGKQMSIDADMRAGLIDLDTARQKRQELQVESRFYGALDGAMKFVKGDAIAGIIIVIINLVGGLIIGTISEGLGLAEAATKYSILTVGDGLLAQIPALMCSLAAGMVVTRVVSVNEEALGREVIRQIGQVRATKFLIGILSFALAFAPGIPWWPFILFSLLLLVAGLADLRTSTAAKKEAHDGVFQPRLPSLLEVRLSRDLLPLLGRCPDILSHIDRWRLAVYESTGLLLLRPDFTSLDEAGIKYQVSVRGISIEACTIEVGAEVTSADYENTPLKILQQILAKLQEIVQQRKIELIDDIMTRRILDFFERVAPELVANVVPQVITVTQLTTVFKNLIREEISIKHLDIILQSISENSNKVGNDRILLEEIRIALGRVIASSLKDSEGMINAITLDPVFDLTISATDQAGKTMESSLINKLVEDLVPFNYMNPVVVCSRHARLAVREALSHRGHNIRVAAHEELNGSPAVNWLSSLSLADGVMEDNAIEMLAAA